MFDRIDAAIEWGNGKAYFFRGDQYVRYNTMTQSVEGGPKPIAGNWPGLFATDIDAAVNWGQGKIYFFKGDRYSRYDVFADRVDDGYPKPIAGHWPKLWTSGIDAAVNWWNGKAYFFKGSEYLRYDIGADKVDDGYPKPIAGQWAGLFDRDIDACINWGDGKAYFFRGNEYARYDLAQDAVDLGPKPIPADLVHLNDGGRRAIAWGSRVSAAFHARVTEICADLGVEPSFLMAAMAFETGRKFSPSVTNPVSGAIGLIQFMPSTAAALGTSTDQLRVMSAEQQLDYVAKYFRPYRGKLLTLADVYMAILWPRGVGKPAEYVLFASPEKAYAQNAGLDFNSDTRVEKNEAEGKVRPLLVEGLKLAL